MDNMSRLPTRCKCETCGALMEEDTDMWEDSSVLFICRTCNYVLEFYSQDGKVYGMEIWT